MTRYRPELTYPRSLSSRGRDVSTPGTHSMAGLELIKVEKLTHTLNMLAKIDRIFETFETCMNETRNMINSSSCNVYILDDSLYHKLTQKMTPHKQRFFTKISFEGISYNVMTNNFTGQMKPSFTTIEQAKYGFRTNEKMVFPINN